jgi:hypothetical protein
MAANGRFHAIQLNAGAADLHLPVFAPKPVIEPIGAPPNQVPGSEYSQVRIACVALVSSRLTPSLRPNPEGNIRALNEQLAHLTFRCQLSIFVDNRQFIAQQRITDGNPLFAFRHNFTNKPLHHRCLGGGVDDLD